VAIEVSGPFEFKYDRLHNPERVYFDIKGALPSMEGRRIWNKVLESGPLPIPGRSRQR
jgi:hypothetical protein